MDSGRDSNDEWVVTTMIWEWPRSLWVWRAATPMLVVAVGFVIAGIWQGYGLWPSLGIAMPPLAIGGLRCAWWVRVMGQRRIRGSGSELEVAGTRIPLGDIKSLYIHRGTTRPEWAVFAYLPQVNVDRRGRVPVQSGPLLACTPAEVEELVAAVGGWASKRGLEWEAAPPTGRWGVW